MTSPLGGRLTDPGFDLGLGPGGEPLHTWVMEPDEVDSAVLTEMSGAVVLGRRLFDIIDGPHGWNDERRRDGRRRHPPVCG